MDLLFNIIKTDRLSSSIVYHSRPEYPKLNVARDVFKCKFSKSKNDVLIIGAQRRSFSFPLTIINGKDMQIYTL